MPLTDNTRARARELIARYPKPRSALLPMLHLVQAEEGYVTPAGIALCAEELGLTKAEVGAVATFYTMYKRRPTGEYLVSVCTNTLCAFLGGDEIYKSLSAELGVGHDQTTADGTITLEHAECLAACDYAPVVTVNYEFFDQQTVASAGQLVHELRAGRRPLPTRGAPIQTFRDIEFEIAGFPNPDTYADSVASGLVGEPTVRGLTEAVARSHEAPAFDPDTPIPGLPKEEEPPPPPPPPEPPAEKESGTSVDRQAADVTGEHDVPSPERPSQSGGQQTAPTPQSRRTRGG